MSNSSALYTAAQVRELDRLAIASGIPGIQLMKRAGKAVLDVVLECWPRPERITVYVGTGHNGGDGYIVAALAAQRQIPVCVIQVGDHHALQGDAKRAYEFAVAQSVEMIPFLAALSLPNTGLVVDALLGTGFKGELRAPFLEAIQQIEQLHRSGLPVVAVDIPSGLHSDSGAVGQACVKADITVTFIALKRGLMTAEGPQQCGEIFLDDLEVPASVYEGVDAATEKLELESLLANLPPRKRTAHKGDFGHVLVVGGEAGFGGAVAMASESALRCGAGLVSVATRTEHVAALLARRPELMAHGVENHHTLLPLLQRATVLVIGPGLGQSPWSEQMLYHSVHYAAQKNIPLVMDADALNLLAEGRVVQALSAPVILTPHPGEAARLLNRTTAAIQQDRFAAVQQLQQKYRATAILKGAGSLVAGDGTLSLCADGNPGMASGGMGDVLSGVLGALLAQHLTPLQAAELGVCLHARAADVLAEQQGERGMLATDLIPVMRALMNGDA